MKGAEISSVLFVCVGNVCRSPMAAASFSHRLGERPITVASAGLAALVGEPAEPHAVALMKERGIDLSQHRARQLTPELGRGFELILVMEERHLHAVEQIFPEARGRVHRLGRFGEFDVFDPYRQPRSAFESSLALIDRGVADFARAFWRAP